ncbi:3'-5' exonuclease [Flavobacteriaceae bacterium F89]|uniref:3'-5' exonuclease n=1 Tax=Cerina litoralis TaxID=2874477 RepID=A0AAE3EUT7_9FLAO|nr:3'-5' exonuclease [Cerina litoralis]MCG2460057.1 3'-5' exonuclease [Cerina litoralis]
MIRLFKRKKIDLPDFWKEYEKSFEEKIPNDVNDVRFVVFDTETTGFDYFQDRILCIGALILVNWRIDVKKCFEIYIHQESYRKETAKIHGILKHDKADRLTELKALELWLAYIGNAVLVAHHAHFDVTMINRALARNSLPPMKNKVLDTGILYKKTLLRSNLIQKKERYSLDDLATKFDISKKDRHTALGDSYITSIAFIKILYKLKEKRNWTMQDLSARRKWWK